MKYLPIILIIMFTSCKLTKQQRADNRVAKKIEKIKAKHPESFKNVTTETVRIDTVIEEVKIHGETAILPDSSVVDSLQAEIKRLLTEKPDSSLSGLPDSIKEIIYRYVPKLINIDTVNVDTLGIQLKIWHDKSENVLKYNIYKPEQHIEAKKDISTINIQKTEVINKVPWYIWVIIVSLASSIPLAYFKK